MYDIILNLQIFFAIFFNILLIIRFGCSGIPNYNNSAAVPVDLQQKYMKTAAGLLVLKGT